MSDENWGVGGFGNYKGPPDESSGACSVQAPAKRRNGDEPDSTSIISQESDLSIHKTQIKKAFQIFGAFNPDSDSLTQAFGSTTTRVLVRIWRFCQMSSGTCTARHQRIADDLALTKLSVCLAIKTLVQYGLIIEVDGDNWIKGSSKKYKTVDSAIVKMGEQLEGLIKKRKSERAVSEENVRYNEQPRWTKGELLHMWNVKYGSDF